MSGKSRFYEVMDKRYVILSDLIFMDRQNIRWQDAEVYAKRYVGQSILVINCGDVIHIGSDFPTEFKGSEDTKRLKGTNAKAKANSIIILLELIQYANNKRFQDNHKTKHDIDAKGGWGRYTSRFAYPIYNDKSEVIRYNLYRIEILVRCSKDNQLFLYDLVNIKKEGEGLKVTDEKKEVDTPH